MQKIIIALAVIILVALGAYVMLDRHLEVTGTPEPEVVEEGGMMDEMEETQEEEMSMETETVIGQSVEGRDIVAYHFGATDEGDDTELLFVGGVHGGYSWNTTLLSYELVDHLAENPELVPEGVRVTVVPTLNPDGLYETVGVEGRFQASDVPEDADRVAGRFNANGVDLNRNFDCEWEPEGVWQSRTVDAGERVFSEPESAALRSYVEAYRPAAAVVYYSSAGGVFASDCRGGVLDETIELTNLYADESGYRAYESFDFYAITGDAVNWLAKEGIPAVSVLLSTPESVEWAENRRAIEALIARYAN